MCDICNACTLCRSDDFSKFNEAERERIEKEKEELEKERKRLALEEAEMRTQAAEQEESGGHRGRWRRGEAAQGDHALRQ